MPGAASVRSRIFQPQLGIPVRGVLEVGDGRTRLDLIVQRAVQRHAIGVVDQAFGRNQSRRGQAFAGDQQPGPQFEAGGDAVRLLVQHRHHPEGGIAQA